MFRKEPIVVDVRAEAEFRRSHIPGALNISAREEATVVKNIESRNISKDTAILFYSGSGTRSKRVTRNAARWIQQSLWSRQRPARMELEGFPIQRGKIANPSRLAFPGSEAQMTCCSELWLLRLL